MDIERILSELRQECDRLTSAIDALEGSQAKKATRRQPPRATARRKRRLTAEGRKRLSDMMKKRWAERRRKTA